MGNQPAQPRPPPEQAQRVRPEVESEADSYIEQISAVSDVESSIQGEELSQDSSFRMDLSHSFFEGYSNASRERGQREDRKEDAKEESEEENKEVAVRRLNIDYTRKIGSIKMSDNWNGIKINSRSLGASIKFESMKYLFRVRIFVTKSLILDQITWTIPDAQVSIISPSIELIGENHIDLRRDIESNHNPEIHPRKGGDFLLIADVVKGDGFLTIQTNGSKIACYKNNATFFTAGPLSCLVIKGMNRAPEDIDEVTYYSLRESIPDHRNQGFIARYERIQKKKAIAIENPVTMEEYDRDKRFCLTFDEVLMDYTLFCYSKNTENSLQDHEQKRFLRNLFNRWSSKTPIHKSGFEEETISRYLRELKLIISKEKDLIFPDILYDYFTQRISKFFGDSPSKEKCLAAIAASKKVESISKRCVLFTLDPKNLIKNLLKNISNLTQSQNYLRIDTLLKGNTAHSNKLLEEANTSIEELVAYIEKYSEELNHQIKYAMDLLKTQLERKKVQRAQLIKSIDNQKWILKKKQCLECVQTCTMFITFFTPTLRFVGYAALILVKAYESNDSNSDYDPKSAREDLQQTYKEYNIRLNESKVYEIKNKVDAYKFIFECRMNAPLTENQERAKSEVDDIYERLNTNISDLSTEDINELSETLKVIDANMPGCDRQEALEICSRAPSLNKKFGFQDFYSLCDAGQDTFKHFKNDSAQLEQMKKDLENHNELIIGMEEERIAMQGKCEDQIEVMRGSIDKFARESSRKGHAQLNVSQWKMNTYLRGVKNYMNKIASTPEIKEDFKDLFEKIDIAIDYLAQIFHNIQGIEESARASIYIAEIAKVGYSVMPPDCIDLELSLKRSLVTEQINNIKGIIKHVYFPFANYFFSVGVDWVQKEVQKIADNVDTHLISIEVQEILSQVQSIKSQITDFDSAVINTKFFTSNGHTPFYEWSRDDPINVSMIEDLLRGDSVTVRPDISKSQKSCVKFNTIKIQFVHRQEEEQKNLDMALSGFSYDMIHMGNSYYKFDEKMYLLPSNALLLTSQFGNDDENSVTKKLRESEPILSPFATWKIKLHNETNDFSSLQPFLNNVDVYLIGEGSYVRENVITGIEEYHMDKYYSNQQVESM